ncbi:MAG: hypothetical protein HDT13_03345 [Butyrivibrio sp.]|nr:hypothetical protein [Butyrivibrio sp.]
MKKYQIQKLIAVLLIICIVFSGIPAYADVDIDESKVIYAEQTVEEVIPKAAKEYVENIFTEVCIAAVSFARDIKNDQTITYELKLGKPYIIYNFEKYQDEIYNYPLIADGRIEFVLSVLGTNGGYTYQLSMGGDMLRLLNELDYINNDCVFYVINDELYYECGKNGETNFEPVVMYEADEMHDADELLFAAKSFEEKKRIIRDKIEFFKPVEPTQTDLTESEEIKFGKTVTLRSPQRQYGYEMCWACVVATIVNTLNWTHYTGYDICNRMGIGFNAGAEIEDMKLALSYYSVNYKRRDDYLSWEQIKQNIDAGYPVAILTVYSGLNPNITGHTVTLMGYDKTGSKEYLYVWDSQDGNAEGEKVEEWGDNYHMIIYSDYIYFLANDNAFLWRQTLSQY